jgi:biopolymer transport protein ExbD
MNLRRRKRIESEVNTHSLNDIMFFLLLFFLITSTMVNPNVIPINLPKAQGERAIVNKNVTVTIDENNEFFVNKKPTDSENLKTAIEEEKKLIGQEEVVILVNADEDVPVKKVALIMQYGKELNLKVLLAVKGESNKK